DLHGALEARLPLALLGLPLPRRITVGIQASKPAKTPAPLPAPQGVSSELLGTEDSGQHRGARGGEPFVLVRTWARVTLARPPKK
ncbi:MAG: hypothetical protein KGK30_07665, partial [Elusimicrobia bacterium]|nr:hypothetical protein [Elusimicrobiota bacterium]